MSLKYIRTANAVYIFNRALMHIDVAEDTGTYGSIVGAGFINFTSTPSGQMFAHPFGRSDSLNIGVSSACEAAITSWLNQQ